ncbi:MAG TPA: thiamine pyrophosphate-dependent enzyme [Gemmatimonadaceae bacterium]|nr:thiamine pyrophosphate-dependent enzyme [Gemmatimonadaceae bacterium]
MNRREGGDRRVLAARRRAKATSRMPLVESVAVVRDGRGDDDIVITSMGNAREWMAMGPLHPRDFVYVPSAMGHATSLGLGLALAQPNRRVIVLMGDGSLLMNLGSLVTIASLAPKNLVVVLYDNGVYEITGSQPTPGTSAARARGDSVDFAAIARASGWSSVQRYSALDDWQNNFAKVMKASGPTLVVLDVEATNRPGPRSPGKTAQRAPEFMAAIRSVANGV